MSRERVRRIYIFFQCEAIEYGREFLQWITAGWSIITIALHRHLLSPTRTQELYIGLTKIVPWDIGEYCKDGYREMILAFFISIQECQQRSREHSDFPAFGSPRTETRIRPFGRFPEPKIYAGTWKAASARLVITTLMCQITHGCLHTIPLWTLWGTIEPHGTHNTVLSCITFLFAWLP